MKLKKMLPLLLICTVFTGCWDKVEIDKKSLISTMAIDAGEQIGKEKELKGLKPNEPFTAMEIKKIHVTLGTPDISKLGPNKGPTAEDVYIDTDAYSMQDAISKASSKSSRVIGFSHIRLLVLSSELLYHPDTFKEVVDYLQRQPALDREMMVAISKGKAEDYIKYKPKMEKNIENYITGLMDNTTRNTVLPVSLNDFLTSLNENNNAILPCIDMDKDKKELKISGVGLIKDYRLKGYLEPIETANLEMLRGKASGVKRVIYMDGHPIDASVDSVGKKIRMKNVDDKLVFDIDVDLEGEVKGDYMEKTLYSKDVINSIEQNFDKSIEEECEQVVKITQNEFELDPIGINEYVKKYHPKIWEQKKNNWPETYKNSVINVNVHTKIRRIGVVK